MEHCETQPKPPKGIQNRNQFWQDHLYRFWEDGECKCGKDDFQCLKGDAEYYADCTEYDMPGRGSLIQSAKRIYAKLQSMDIGQKELPAGWKWVKLGSDYLAVKQRRS